MWDEASIPGSFEKVRPLYVVPLLYSFKSWLSVGVCEHIVSIQQLRLPVSSFPDIGISGCQRSRYLQSVYTYRIQTFSSFTRVQASRRILRGILAMCSRNTQMLFFFFFLMKLHAFQLSSIFLSFC